MFHWLDKKTLQLHKWIADIIKNPVISKLLDLGVLAGTLFTLSKCIIYLCNYCDEIYQTPKDAYGHKAILMFVIFLFLVSKVKLLNWQSVIASLVYWPIALQYPKLHLESPDLLKGDYPLIFTFWILIMIGIDMALYGKTRKFTDFKKPALLLTLFFILNLMMHGGLNESKVYLVFFVLYLIPFAKKEWEQISVRFSISWLIAFTYICYRSFKYVPYTGGRYFGSFTNIGAFGLFLGGSFATALFLVYAAKSLKTRKSVWYVLSWVYVAAVYAMMVLVQTRALLAGVLLAIISLVICYKKDADAKQFKKRFWLVIGIFALLLILGFAALFAIYSVQKAPEKMMYWWNMSQEGGIRGRIGFWVSTALYMFREKVSCYPWISDNVILNAIDNFTSNRLTLIVAFLNNASFAGNGYTFIEVPNIGETYMATNAHNMYAEVIYAFGYVTGITFIVWLLFNAFSNAKSFRTTRSLATLLALIWMPTLLGMYFGEICTAYFPMAFMTLFVITPNMVTLEDSSLQEGVCE